MISNCQILGNSIKFLTLDISRKIKTKSFVRDDSSTESDGNSSSVNFDHISQLPTFPVDDGQRNLVDYTPSKSSNTQQPNYHSPNIRAKCNNCFKYEEMVRNNLDTITVKMAGYEARMELMSQSLQKIENSIETIGTIVAKGNNYSSFLTSDIPEYEHWIPATSIEEMFNINKQISVIKEYKGHLVSTYYR